VTPGPDETVVAKRWFILALPALLIASMYGAFRYLTARFGFPIGYLAAFGASPTTLSLHHEKASRPRCPIVRLAWFAHHASPRSSR
jgi:hypothetical protein